MHKRKTGNLSPTERLLSTVSRPVLGSLLLTAFCALLFTIGSDAIPVIDRDEARFAQASKQMLESGNYLEIFFQDQPRNKKPPLTHWLQAGSASVLGGETLDRIGAYRLPSMLGGWLAVLATFLLGTAWVGRRASFLGALLLCASIGVMVEVNQAKSDGLLLGFTTTAILALGPALWARSLSRARALVGWAALGLAILTKGPIAPMVLGMTLLAFVIFGQRRRINWTTLRWPLGLLIALIIAAPWFVAVQLFGGSDFMGDALSEDLFSKLLGPQESHGAVPGYYLLLSLALFFPGSVLLVPALAQARNHIAMTSGDEAAKLIALFCWIVPTWLLFELIPTKLPHYVYPVYPALSLLVGWFLVMRFKHRDARLVRQVPVVLIVVALTGLLIALLIYQPNIWPWLAVSAMGLLVFVILFSAARRTSNLRFVSLATCLSCLSLFMIGEGIAPRLETFWVSRSIDRIVTPLNVEPARIGSSYHEPSTVFLLGTEVDLINPKQAFESTAFDVLVLPTGQQDNLETWIAVGAVTGFNYSKGDPIDLTVWHRSAD